jgi:hypothetical protein
LDFVGIICNTFAVILKQLDYEKTNGAGSCASYAFLQLPERSERKQTASGREPRSGERDKVPFRK